MTEMSVTYPTKRAGGISQRGPISRPTKKLAPIEDAPSLTPCEFNQNKRELALSLRKSNASNTDPAPWAFWDVEGSLKTTVIDSSDVLQQLSIAEGGVNYSARRYNDLKVLSTRLTRELKLKLDDLDEQKKQYDRLEALRKAQTEEGQRITYLQKESQNVEDDIARKVHYTRQLLHLQDRLKRNQIRLEAHMEGMADTVKALEKEGMEVRVLRNSLDASLSKAITVSEATQTRLSVARKEREILLEQRRNEVKNSLVLQEWIKKREESKIALALELRGDLTKEEERFLREQISEKVEKTKHLQKATEESQRKLQAMEDAFTKLKQVTAVSSLEEMHEKFSNQRNNKKALEHDVKEAEMRLVTVKGANQRQEELFQDLKSSGGGIAEFSRETINRLEASVELARNNHRTARATLDRLSNVLLGLNQGSRGLLQRVQPFLELADGGVFELTQTDEDLPWADTLDALSSAEQVLAKMLDVINGEGSALGAMQTNESDDDDNNSTKADDSFATLEHVPALANNIRVKSTKIIRDELLGRTNHDDDSMYEDSTINRQTLSIDRQSNSFIPGNSLQGNSHSIHDMEALEEPNLNTGITTLGDGGSDAFPTRVVVKKNSQMTTLEAQKKAEQEIRRKRLQDRVAGRGGDDVGVGIASIAKVKAQKAMADRLSSSRSLMTLPDGVTMSDGVMTKTEAFLMKMPELN